MQSKQALVPKLRFEDGSGNSYPDWKEKPLSDVSHNVMYGMNAAATKYDGVTKYIRITDIDEESHKFRSDSITSPDEEAADQFILHKGDIVFARTGASVGKSYLYNEADGNLAFAGFLIRFSICSKQTNPFFIFLQTQTQKYWKWVKVYSMRSGQPGINAEEYKTFPIHTPSLPEQEKIAAFLTSVDDRIDQLKRKKSLLQDYKKGAMQKLFSQELRFKDEQGKDFPDWEEKKVKDTFEIIPTKKFQILGSKISEEGQYPVVDQGKDLVAGFSDDKDKLFDKGEVIVFGDHTTHLKFIDFKFVVGEFRKLLAESGSIGKFLNQGEQFAKDDEAFKPQWDSLIETLVRTKFGALLQQYRIRIEFESIMDKASIFKSKWIAELQDWEADTDRSDDIASAGHLTNLYVTDNPDEAEKLKDLVLQYFTLPSED